MGERQSIAATLAINAGLLTLVLEGCVDIPPPQGGADHFE